MRKKIMTLCVVLVSATTLAFGQPSRKAEPEAPTASLCQLISNSEKFEQKTVRVEATLETATLDSFIIGLMLTSPGCESVDAYFEKAEDEARLLNTLRDAATAQAQVTVVGRLRGERWPGCEFNYGPMGVLKYQLAIESVSAIKPLANEFGRSGQPK
jgi:hypothetical protein